MLFNFDKHAEQGNLFVRLVGEELNVPPETAGNIIRPVFHALRNCLSHEASFHLMAQLPVSLKGVYVDGWKFDKDGSRVGHVNDFLEVVNTEDAGISGYNFSDKAKARQAVAVVLKGLNYIVAPDAIAGILQVLTPELKKYIHEILEGEGIVM